AKRFERAVAAVFRKHGFLAGEVSQSGTWKTPEGDTLLVHKQGARVPGQIDVLALHQERSALFVVECKVLALPHNANRARNIILKIGRASCRERLESSEVAGTKPEAKFEQVIAKHFERGCAT